MEIYQVLDVSGVSVGNPLTCLRCAELLADQSGGSVQTIEVDVAHRATEQLQQGA